jgi:uncharacterized coiled-coil DUF342 family protein
MSQYLTTKWLTQAHIFLVQVSELMSLHDTQVQELVQEVEALRSQAHESSTRAQAADAEAQHASEELAAQKVRYREAHRPV